MRRLLPAPASLSAFALALASPVLAALAGMSAFMLAFAPPVLGALAALAGQAGCKPGGVGEADKLCARAAAMYAQCESREGLHPQQWELVIDRWRGLCRAALTGETRQLLPDGAAIWAEMTDDVKAGLREQAACAAKAATCPEYAACEK